MRQSAGQRNGKGAAFGVANPFDGMPHCLSELI